MMGLDLSDVKRIAARTKRAAKSKALDRKIARVAKKTVLKTSEAKHTSWRFENINLNHNLTSYHPSDGLGFYRTNQGFDDNNTQQGFPNGTDIREGDECYLENINLKMWLSNKNDRPNVMYRIILFEYSEGETVDNAMVFFTQTNKMLDRVNNKKVRVLKSKYVKLNGPDLTLNGHERSQIVSINHKFRRPKKIRYQENSSIPKNTNMAFVVVAYDAYGTLQTDNIGSFAYDLKLTWRDP